MPTFKNKVTGAKITTDLAIGGEDWEPVEENRKKAAAKKASDKSKIKAEDDEN